ncbi:MAG: hypothetical protein QUS09_08005 [Methanotrichaceae archaeon]|nr:hypothetical protein [Methanotrichaceae archaeon]
MSHYWIIEGNTGVCKYCHHQRHDFVNTLELEGGRTTYRRRADYLAIKPKILALYQGTGSIDKVCRSFDPPLPATTVRQLVKQWEKQVDLQTIPLRPETKRITLRGDPERLAEVGRLLSKGIIEIVGQTEEGWYVASSWR